MSFGNNFQFSASFNDSSSSPKKQKTPPSFAQNSSFSTSITNDFCDATNSFFKGFGKAVAGTAKELQKIDESHRRANPHPHPHPHPHPQHYAVSTNFSPTHHHAQPSANPYYNGPGQQQPTLQFSVNSQANSASCTSNVNCYPQPEMQQPYPISEPGYPPVQPFQPSCTPMYPPMQPVGFASQPTLGQDCIVSEQQFQTLFVKPGSLLLLHVNVESLRKTSLKKIKDLISPCGNSPDIICVSDTREPNFDSDFTLPSYSFRQARPKFVVGGVGIYAKNNMFCRERNDLSFQIQECENAWIELRRGKDGRDVVVGAVHRRSVTNLHLKEFIMHLKEVIQRISVMEQKIFYILGSINLDLLSSKKENQEYRNELLKLGCKFLINQSTHISKIGSSKGLLDHVYTNDCFVEGSGVIHTADAISEHRPVYCVA